METAIQDLMKRTAERPRPKDLEKDPAYEAPRRLRNAIRAQDKSAAKKVSLEKLNQWCSLFPLLTWDDPKMLGRLARFYLLDQEIFQVWEIRYRSNAPGRPLVYLTETAEFPGPEFLEYCEETYGHHQEYHIAARVPRWRLVWKSSDYGW